MITGDWERGRFAQAPQHCDEAVGAASVLLSVLHCVWKQEKVGSHAAESSYNTEVCAAVYV